MENKKEVSLLSAQASSSATKQKGTKNGDRVDWKVFKGDSEAGRLLSRLYGVQQTNRDCSIKYPKIKTGNQSLNERSPWNQSHVLTNAELNRNRKKEVKVPKFGQCKKNNRNESINKVALIPRRKTYERCQQTWEQTSMLNRNYRPPVNIKQNSSDEKDRLCKLHEYGGGCALPHELTSPKQTIIPDEKGKLEKEDGKANNEKGRRAVSFADHIVMEIKERQEFQMEMEKIGCGDSTRDKVVEEIASRIDELRKIDKSRLKELE